MDCVYELVRVKEGWSHWHLKYNLQNGVFIFSTTQGAWEESQNIFVKNLNAERI